MPLSIIFGLIGFVIALIGVGVLALSWPRDDDYDPLEMSIRPARSATKSLRAAAGGGCESGESTKFEDLPHASNPAAADRHDRALEIIGDNCWQRWRLWVTAVERREGVWWCLSRLGWHTLPQLREIHRPRA